MGSSSEKGLAPARQHRQGRDQHRITVIEHLPPDTYGLLILAPEAPLGSGWLGGDRVVGRAALRELLIKAARLDTHERRRLSIHLPGRDLTLAWDEIDRMLAPGKTGLAHDERAERT